MISPYHPQVSTLIGDVQIASTLSYQVQTEKSISALMYKAIGYKKIAVYVPVYNNSHHFDIYYTTNSNIGSHLILDNTNFAGIHIKK